MKHLKWMIAVVLLTLSGWAQTSSTQQPPAAGATGQQPQGQLFFVEVDHVKPGSVSQYEAALKQVTTEVTPVLQPSTDMPGFRTWATDDFRFASLTPVKDYGQFGNLLKQWDAMMQKLGKQKTDQWDASILPNVEYTDRYFMREVPEWSYMPAGVQMTPDQTPVCLVEEWYMTAEGRLKIDSFAKAYRRNVEQKKLPHGYIAYRGGLGMEQPVVIVVACAKTRAELAANDEADNKLLGPETMQMVVRDFLPLARKVKRFHVQYRPELSVQTAMDKAAMAKPQTTPSPGTTPKK
jgi:hypothetical protein